MGLIRRIRTSLIFLSIILAVRTALSQKDQPEGSVGMSQQNETEHDGKQLDISMSNFSLKNTTEIKRAFEFLDKNNDNVIYKEDLIPALKVLGTGTDDEYLDTIVKMFDLDGNGIIDLGEFSATISKYENNPVYAADIRRTFNALDKEGTGFISGSNLTGAVSETEKPWTDEEVTGLMTLADRNRSNKKSGVLTTLAAIGSVIKLSTSLSKPDTVTGDHGGCQWVGRSYGVFGCSEPICPGGNFVQRYRSAGASQEYRSEADAIFTIITYGIYGSNGKVYGRNFGKLCFFGQKALCCKIKVHDPTWIGLWERADNNHKYNCNIRKDARLQCGGYLKCAEVSTASHEKFEWEIGGYPHCQELQKRGTKWADAVPGVIKFVGNKFNKLDEWFKV